VGEIHIREREGDTVEDEVEAFLDRNQEEGREIHQLVQAKFLHAPQESSFARLGAGRDLPVGVRVIAATEREAERRGASCLAVWRARDWVLESGRAVATTADPPHGPCDC
jgi:sigma-54 interacting transcriptional regulator